MCAGRLLQGLADSASLEIFANGGKREGRSVSVIAIKATRSRREGVVRSCYAFLVEREAAATEYLFYDGHCGLCHRAVKFVLRHDRSGELFRFAPLQGETFLARVAAERRAGLPDSVVVLTRDGELLVRSDASLHILRRLGGGWRALAAVLGVIPRVLRDLVYDFVARIRYRVFGKRDDLCPIVPPELRVRFDP
jgi:predicted DCC family thiol-disulfide oxidoreductase YuxK